VGRERHQRRQARQQRFVTQTSHPAFNAEYTARIGSEGQAAADAWAHDQVRAGAVRWNKPHGGTYSVLVVMVEGPLDDGTDRVGISHFALSPYAGLPELTTFSKHVAEQLDDDQRCRLAPPERAAVAAAAR
jgi:hypothetical protein